VTDVTRGFLVFSYKATGHVILFCVDFDEFTNQGKEGSNFSVLFEPNERTALDTYSATKNYIILSVMENVRSKLVFLYYHPTIKFFFKVGEDSVARIRAAHVGGYDSYDNDKFWFTTSGFLQPSTMTNKFKSRQRQ
jgi:prolyl oligopeptidase